MFKRNLVSSKALNVTSKLLTRWSDPVVIVKIVGINNVLLANRDTGIVIRRVHVSQFKPYVSWCVLCVCILLICCLFVYPFSARCLLGSLNHEWASIPILCILSEVRVTAVEQHTSWTIAAACLWKPTAPPRFYSPPPACPGPLQPRAAWCCFCELWCVMERTGSSHYATSTTTYAANWRMCFLSVDSRLGGTEWLTRHVLDVSTWCEFEA